MSTEILAQWRKAVYAKRPRHIFMNAHTKRKNGPKYRTLLALDSASAHRNDTFKNIMAKNYDTKVVIIPGGMTPILQPADISWNRTVKSKILNLWINWITVQIETMPLEDIKRPSYTQVAEWSLQAWNEVSKEIIIDSFAYCNLSKTRDDSRLHSKLLNVITDGTIPDDLIETDLNECPYEGFGDDLEDEETQEVIDFDDELGILAFN